MPIDRNAAFAEAIRRGLITPDQAVAKGYKIPKDAGGMEVLGDGYKRDRLGRTYVQGPRGGMSQVGGPNDTMIKDATSAASGINNALAGIDRVDRQLNEVKDLGPFGWFTDTNDMAVLSQSVKDLQLKLKEQPYNLGVLNGPDLALLEDIVANPNKLRSAAFRKSIQPRLANLASILGDTYREQAGSFEAQGGRDEALPPLYRSPRSAYTPQEWGNQGRVPQKKTGGRDNGLIAEARAAIAKGAPRDKVIQRLREQGISAKGL